MPAIVPCLGLGLLPASPPDCFAAKVRKILKRHLQKIIVIIFCPVVDLITLNCSIFMWNRDGLLFGKANPFLRCIEKCW